MITSTNPMLTYVKDLFFKTNKLSTLCCNTAIL